ncbi:MAG: hypothetical protein NVSMB18_34590 [Acetobacteraceae bacterium]
MRPHPLRPCWAATLLCLLAGCTQTANPEPSARYDGRYVGTRQSNLLDACGITALAARTAAEIRGGRLTMQMFDPGTRMTGTVGEDGRVRASGLWKSPRSFANFTLLDGRIVDGQFDGVASDSRCVTDIALRRMRGR